MKTIELTNDGITIQFSKEELAHLMAAALVGVAMGCESNEIAREVWSAAFRASTYDEGIQRATSLVNLSIIEWNAQKGAN